MHQALFHKNEAAKTMTVERSFAAPRSRVWQAWTKKELFEKWWAPKPWQAKVKTFDFREGGRCHYAMVGPDGSQVWGFVGYQSIVPETSFTALDAFCDEEGNIDHTMPSMHWKVDFQDEEAGEHTKVLLVISFEKPEDMQKIIELGFEEGFALGLAQLEDLLAH
jgi:uncharacterized protein YndB with AHSA1/START domain